MSDMLLETCWAFNERWISKFYYKVASCWLFRLSHTAMHGSMNIKTTNTHSEYVIPIALPLAQWLHNAPQCYLTRTLPAYLVSCHRSLSALKTEAVNYSVTFATLWERQISQPKVVFVTNSLYRADCCLFRCHSTVARMECLSYLPSLGLLCPKPRGSDSVTWETG